MRSLKRVQAAALLVFVFAVVSSCDKTDPTAPDNSTISVTANPASLRLGPGGVGHSNITAIVQDADGRPLSGIRVRFETDAGSLEHGADGSLTNSNGVATDVLTLRFSDNDATVTARASGAAPDSVTVTPGGNAPPVANVTVNPSRARPGQSVTFDGSGSTDPDGSIASYLWTFHSGDGDATATTATVVKTFTLPGDVTGTLVVTDDEGKTASKNIPTVQIALNFAPTASVTPPTQTVNVNGVANFNASASSDADGTVVAYDWNWGDGTNLERSLTPTRSHAYSSAGAKSVRLTVWDNGATSCANPSTTAGDPPCNGSLESTAVTVSVTVNP